MAYSDDEQVKLKKGNTQSAIEFAIAGRWKDAAGANKAILELFPDDIEALNRLGRAYMELGEYAEAQKAYRKSMKLDPYNSIADRNLKRLEVLAVSGAKPAQADGQGVASKVYIEEIGKAKLVSLTNLASREVLARVNAGDKVNLRFGPGILFVDNLTGQYLGTVDTRHALRLIKLMKGGNKYSVIVVSSSDDKLAVIIREIYQHPTQSGQISFPARPSLAAARKPELDEISTDEGEPGHEHGEIERSVEESDEEEKLNNDDDDDDDDDDEDREV